MPLVIHSVTKDVAPNYYILDVEDDGIERGSMVIYFSSEEVPETNYQLALNEWLLQGNEVTQAIPEPVFRTLEVALTAMQKWIDTFTEQITGKVPMDEKLSWATKEDAARAFLAGNATASQTEFLQAEAIETDETLEVLVDKILQSAQVYRVITAKIAGMRRSTQALLEIAEDPMEYETILLEARAKAQASLQSLLQPPQQ